MSEDRLILAIGRLERAIARVEAAASRPAAPERENPEAEAALQSLTARHDRLKRTVESAISTLDGLIAKG